MPAFARGGCPLQVCTGAVYGSRVPGVRRMVFEGQPDHVLSVSSRVEQVRAVRIPRAQPVERLTSLALLLRGSSERRGTHDGA